MNRARQLKVLSLVAEENHVERALASAEDDARGTVEGRVIVAALRLAQDDPVGAAEALAPTVNGSHQPRHPRWEIQALLVQARASDTLRDRAGTLRALERTLDLAESEGRLLAFLLIPVADLLGRHRGSRTTRLTGLRDPVGSIRTDTGRPIQRRGAGSSTRSQTASFACCGTYPQP